MVSQTIKIGKLKINKIGNEYNLTDIINQYNSIFSKNRFHRNFLLNKGNSDFIKDYCRMMNILYSKKTFNSEKLFTYHKSKKTGYPNTYGNPILLSRYIDWCFPEYSSKSRHIVYEWISNEVNNIGKSDDTINSFLFWLNKNESFFLRSNGFDPLTLLREVNFAIKLKEDSFCDISIERIINLNQLMIELGIDFKQRVLIIYNLKSSK